MNDMHIGKAANVGHVKIDKQTNYIYDTDDSCLKDLYITNPEADKQRIEREKGGLLKECYTWILYNDNFLQWRHDPDLHLLWIRGDPGKGKTMLLAGLITELQKTSNDNIFYFFCQAAQPLLRTASYVLRGLIWSIVRKRPALIPYIRKQYNQAGESVFSDHNAWQAVSGILTGILEDNASADCIIMIDALDECIQEREKLIGYITQRSVSCKVKWIISSRNWPEIEAQLDETQNQVRLHLELNHASISKAVVKFVDQKVTQLNSTYNEPTRAQIRNHLVDNANDTFLWVALVCQELEKPGVKHYHSSSILKRFPAGLDELYERMISSINDRDMEWCRAILAVIAVALRPLSLQELAAADRSLTEWIKDKETISSLVTSCGSLLTIRGDTVYTVHESVNDFLRKTSKILPSGISEQQLSIFLSSIKVMQNMLHRNLYELKDNCALIDGIPVLPSAPLTIAGYACTYWVDHFCEWSLTNHERPNSLHYTRITQFLKSKFLYWLEAMSLLRCTSEAMEAMQRLEDKLEARASDELRLLVQDAVRFAFTHRAIMDAAPLQLYDSALIFTPETSKIKRYFSHEISKSIDVFSPDFKHWDTCLHTIPGIGSHTKFGSKCEFSPNGGQAALINRNHDTLLLIDASTGGLVKSIGSRLGVLEGFTFHPNGDSLVTISRDNYEAKLTIFHLPNGEYSKSFTVDEISQANTLSFSPDGQFISLASDFDTVDLWDVASETRFGSCHPISGSIRYIFWIHVLSHPQALLILGDDNISIWTLDTNYQMFQLMSLTTMGYPDAAAVSRDRGHCAVFQGKKELLWYSWGSSITVQKIARFDRNKHVEDASWVGDGSIVICDDFGIELWDLEAKRLVAKVRSDHALSICYGRSRQLASLGFHNGTLKIWNLDTILIHSELINQQSASTVKALTTSPSGKVVVTSKIEEFDMLSIAANGRFHHLPKTLQNLPPGSYYRTDSLAPGHDDYFAVATSGGAIHVFNFDHDRGLYFCERRLGEDLYDEDFSLSPITIQFWGKEHIVSCDDYINFWDLKTGKCLQKLCIPYLASYPRSNITADGRIALGEGRFQVVIWDITCGKKTQSFDLLGLLVDPHMISKSFLAPGGMLAISARQLTHNFIAIGNAKDGSWIRWFSVSDDFPTLNFLTPKSRLDTGFGVLRYDMEHGGSKHKSTVSAEGHWDPYYLRLSYSESEAWLMRGSRRILWIPRQDVDPKRFSIQTDLEADIKIDYV
ncbi:related to vegetatible incompatibility protein HET-E-1 [Fusarium proliferatum]|nr:related to vegetatible incompatibility protein HET-E-1 [Fusarium proliferatum]